MKDRPVPTREALKLLHDGALALARVEAVGMRVDVSYLDRTIIQTEARVKELERSMTGSEVWKVWKRRFGTKANLGSRPQLGTVLFDCMGFKSGGRTGKSYRHSTDEAALSQVDHPFVKDLLRTEKLKKLISTNLKGIRRELVGEYLHPFFNLNTVRTFRSSSSEINFHNLPNRDPELAELVRRAFIPREGWRLIEADYGQLEFKLAACFWEDPAMVKYASDPKADVHRDQASDIFLCTPDEAKSKPLRHEGKNHFVFPLLYGSYYRKCAQNIWEQIPNLKVGEVPARQHLKSKGVRSYDDFEKHMKGVEDRFMRRFPVFARKKEEWWNDYKRKGWFRLATGFVIKWGKEGVCSYNNLLNDPIQGPGFHCLLKSLVIMDKWLRKNKMKTLIVGQIHDCTNADSPPDEVQDYLGKVQEVMTKELPRIWPWIIVPMTVEVDLTEVDGNWFEKKKWVEEGGRWKPAG